MFSRQPVSATWCVVYCKPRKEVQVNTYLRAHGVRTFYPTVKVNPVNPRAATVRGFYPRYLFAQVSEDKGTAPLQWIPGAVGLVHFAGEPAMVADEFIDTLQERIKEIERAGGLHLDGLKHGDRVRIMRGPFAGFDALFDVHVSGEQRVQVLLRWLGRDMKVRINASDVEKRRAR